LARYTQSASRGRLPFCFQSLDQSLNVALQILRISFGGDLVHATGCSLIERFPSVIDQLLIQASIKIPKTVLLVAPCLVGYSPQEGWLALLQSYFVPKALRGAGSPVRVAFAGYVLPSELGVPVVPRVHGFPML
jgi:hypothetical protein